MPFFLKELRIGGTGSTFGAFQVNEIPPLFEKKALAVACSELDSVVVSLGRRPPKKYRGRAKVKIHPNGGLKKWQSILLA